MDIEKILEKTEQKVQDKKEELKSSSKVKVKRFKRKHFKSELSTTQGFGFQDMKKKPRKLVQELMIRSYDIHIEPVSVAKEDMTVDLFVTVK
jgi:hypothetical protein